MIAEKFLKSTSTETYQNHGLLNDRKYRKAFIARREYIIYALRLLLLLICALVAHRNIGDHNFCSLWYQTRNGWDHGAFFNEEVDVIDNLIKAERKIEKRIEKDEEILILLGGEGKLLGRILSQHGIFDCMTPDTSIPASMMSEFLALTAMSESGHEKAKDSLTHQQNAHISKETYYSAYQAYFNRLLTWQNSDRLCLALDIVDGIGMAAAAFAGANSTIFDHEFLANVFPGAKFVFVTSDPKRTIYSQFYAATLAEQERRAERGDYGGKRKTKINYSEQYLMQQENANRWSDSWTRYHNHVKDNCIALSSRCQTYKIEDLIIEPDIVLRDIYDSLSIKTAPRAKLLSVFDPTFEHDLGPLVDPELVKQTMGMLMEAIEKKLLDVDAEFIMQNYAQILLIENLYYPIITDLNGFYLDESGVSFANQHRDWMKNLNLDNTGYSIYSAAIYHLEGDFRKIHDFFTLYQNQNPNIIQLRNYQLS